ESLPEKDMKGKEKKKKKDDALILKKLVSQIRHMIEGTQKGKNMRERAQDPENELSTILEILTMKKDEEFPKVSKDEIDLLNTLLEPDDRFQCYQDEQEL